MLRGGVCGSWVVSVQLGWGARAESRAHPRPGTVLAPGLQASRSEEWNELGPGGSGSGAGWGGLPSQLQGEAGPACVTPSQLLTR